MERGSTGRRLSALSCGFALAGLLIAAALVVMDAGRELTDSMIAVVGVSHASP